MISDELQRIYASAPPDISYVETIELSHTNFSQVWRFSNDVVPWNFTVGGSVYAFTPLPFEVQQPAANSGGLQELNLVLCNVGLEMVNELEAAQATPTNPINCTYRIFLNQDLSTPQNNPPLQLTISEVSMDALFITATASRFDVLNRPFPKTLYTVERFPGLKR